MSAPAETGIGRRYGTPRCPAIVLAVFLAATAATAAPAGEDLPIPQSLREGWGFGDDVRDFGESLDGGYELSERDVDCDGKPEVLLEQLARRGTTGNRAYVLFDHGSGGYRYLGEAAAIWAVLDFGSPGGCYLATYSKGGAGRWTVALTSTAGGSLAPLGRLELVVGDAGSDEDNALLSALRTGGLEEERLRRLFAPSGPRAVTVDGSRHLPWVERSSIEEVVETVEGYGLQVFERVLPGKVAEAPASPWWGPVSARVARQWAGAVAAMVAAGEVGEERPHWLPAQGADVIEILGARVESAARLSLPLGRPPVGVAVGSFDARLTRTGDAPPRAIEITWAAVLETTRLGEPERLLRLFLGTAGDGESRRIFRLERITNLDFDREQEIVLDEEGYAGRILWVLDLSRPGDVVTRELHADAWD